MTYNKKVRMIVAGGRDFFDYGLVKEKLDYYLKNVDSPTKNVVIVSGGASGADQMGELYARENNIPLEVFEADWGKHGKSAGPIRNREMADNATHLISFYDGKSQGTGNMIKTALDKALIVRVVTY